MGTSLPWHPVAVLADRVRSIRRKRGLTALQLADQMTAQGLKWDRGAVAKLESGHRSTVALQDIYGFALVLNVSPLSLLTPGDPSEHVDLTPATTSSGKELSLWVSGDKPLVDEGVPEWLDWVRELPRWKMMAATAQTRRSTPFGLEMRRQRERAGLSESELASRVGLSTSAVTRLEQGYDERDGLVSIVTPPPALATNIARELGWDGTDALRMAGHEVEEKST